MAGRDRALKTQPEGAMSFHVRVNGKEKEIEEGLTVAGLIRQLALENLRVAVEVNEELVVKKAWEERLLAPGDRVEIVTFVGGG
jgi:sulfur carrier protein